MPSIRINKYLSENGYCSRREADRLIKAGQVFVNDLEARLGDQISDQDTVRVHGRDKRVQPKKTYLLLNKPSGVVVTQNRKTKNNVLDSLHLEEKVFPVGTMDTAIEGLLLLTDDSILANRLLRSEFEHEKEYVVLVDRPLEMSAIKQMQSGLRLHEEITAPAQVRKLDHKRFAIVIREKGTRHIQHLCRALGYQIMTLTRTRILTLKMPSTYPVGNWRHLTESEVNALKKAVGL